MGILALAALLLIDAVPSSAGVDTRGTVITGGSPQSNGTYRMRAYGVEYYSHETHSDDWQVDDIDGTWVRVNDAWVKYVFTVPRELYEHRLITRVVLTVRHDRTDAGCNRIWRTCDDAARRVTAHVYNFKGGEYIEWMELQDTPDATVLSQSLSKRSRPLGRRMRWRDVRLVLVC